MRPDEIDRVRQLSLSAYLSEYPWIPDDYAADIGDVEGRATSELVWVCEHLPTGEPVGTVTLPHPGQSVTGRAGPRDTDLRLLAVAPSARGFGVGEFIMRRIIDLARERRSTRVMLHTSNSMPRAIALYERLGFAHLAELDEVVPRPDGSSYTLLTYALEL